jgi:hypothetical protein
MTSTETLEQEVPQPVPQPVPSNWITLEKYPNYEIDLSTISIRHKRVMEPLRLHRKDKYCPVMLDGRLRYLHRIVGEQFIPNPDPENFRVIDHMDGDKQNNSVKNLRWVSWSLNNRNKKYYKGIKYNFIDSLPEGAKKIETYRGKKLDYDYYHFEGHFYVHTSLNYRELHNKHGYVSVRTSDKKYIRLYVEDF